MNSTDDPFRLDGRVAVITGAASGIGRGAAIAFAKAGARLVLADIDEAGLEETAKEAGGEAQCCRTDVSVRADVDRLAEGALERAGRIDVWANVAGTTTPCALFDVTEELVDRIVAINLKGVLWGCIAAARAMKEAGGGSIINISSTGAIGAPPGQIVYAMTKSGVNAITRNVAQEMGPFDIRANTVSPGWVDTPLATLRFRTEDGGIDPEMREKVLGALRASTPLGTTGEPSDIAHAMLYLASDASRFMTGQNLYVNGGSTLA
jgi:3-oxoacyl-[acyl-carrier protein] reductase